MVQGVHHCSRVSESQHYANTDLQYIIGQKIIRTIHELHSHEKCTKTNEIRLLLSI